MQLIKLLNKGFHSNGLHSFLNPSSYLKLRKGNLKGIDGLYVDGIMLVLFLRLFGFKGIKRNSFDMTSLAPAVFKTAEENNQTIYFIGSKKNEIESAVTKIAAKYPNLKIVGYNDGYIKNYEKKVLKTILELSPDIVIVGMGAGLQEQFLIKLKGIGWRGLGLTCGGFFHQTAKKISYYPLWVDRYNLRWAYRIYDEPYLIKRYVFDYSLFLPFFLKDVIEYKIYRMFRLRNKKIEK